MGITLFILLAIVMYEQASGVVDKPIIYLYPEEETKVSVELPKDDRLLVSYPKYEKVGKY